MNNSIRITLALFMGAFLLLTSPMLHAQDSVWDLTSAAPAEVYYNPASPELTGFTGAVLLQEVQTSGGGADPLSQVQGYSFGVSHDPSLLSLSAATVTTTSSTGLEPDFIDVGVFSDGFTVGVVFSFVGNWTLTYGTQAELAQGDYQLVAGPLSGADPPTAASISKSDSLGNPAVVSVVVVDGGSIPVNGVSAEISLIPFTPEFQMSLDAPATIYYPEASPASETFSAVVNLQEVLLPGGGGTGEYSAVQGGSFAVGHDSSLLEATAVNTIVASTGGLAPDFAEVNLYPDGATQGLVFSFVGDWTLTFETPSPLSSIDYQLLPGVLAGNVTPTVATLAFSNSLGVPAVDNVVVVDGASVAATLLDATLELVPFTGSRFIRGDSTQDGNLNLADGIGVFAYLFQGAANTCLKAMDMDQSNHVSISDGVQVLCSLFCAGSPAPAGPFPDCGVDLESTLTCESFTACP